MVADDVENGQKSLNESIESLKETLREDRDLKEEEIVRQDTDSVISRFAQNHNDEAVALARKNLERDPTNPQLRDWLAFNLYAIDKVDEAIQIYESLIATAESAEQIYYLANCYYKKGEHRKAIVAWQRSIDLAPKSLRAGKAQKRIAKVREKISALKPSPQS